MRNILRATKLFGIVILVSVSFSGRAVAQKNSGGVIRLEETVIEGRVQKPNAFFVSTRHALVYESIEVKESFLEKIHEVIRDGVI